VDCPSREKGQYLAMRLYLHALYVAYRRYIFNKKGTNRFLSVIKNDAGLLAVAPSGFIQEFAEYSLQFPLMLWEYYRHSETLNF
jgi:hypothetical protein